MRPIEHIGVNFTSPGNSHIIHDLIRLEEITFIEVLIDNFLHLDPHKFKDTFPNARFAIHIMNSKFVSGCDRQLMIFGHQVRKMIDVLKPLYVSDHLLCSQIGDIPLAHTVDLDYKNFSCISEAVVRWQDHLQCQILFENFPSLLVTGRDQASFFEQLLRDTHCGLLFDISNAVIAQNNVNAMVNCWDSLIAKTQHFHIGGYRTGLSPYSSYLIDSHDCALADQSLDLLTRILQNSGNRPITLTVERDRNIYYRDISNDIKSVHRAFARCLQN